MIIGQRQGRTYPGKKEEEEENHPRYIEGFVVKANVSDNTPALHEHARYTLQWNSLRKPL